MRLGHRSGLEKRFLHDAALGVGPRGRLLVLMDDHDEGYCGRIYGIELWAAFQTSLPQDATVDVELRDDAGNLIDHESVALTSYRGTVNRSPGKGPGGHPKSPARGHFKIPHLSASR
jgi:hypothetical protein